MTVGIPVDAVSLRAHLGLVYSRAKQPAANASTVRADTDPQTADLEAIIESLRMRAEFKEKEFLAVRLEGDLMAVQLNTLAEELQPNKIDVKAVQTHCRCSLDGRGKAPSGGIS